MSGQVRLVKDGMSGHLQEKTVSPAIPRTAWCLKDARLGIGIIQIACPNNQEEQSDIAHQHVGWPRYIEFTSVPSVRQGCFTNINLSQVSATERKTFLSSKREIFQESQLSSCDCTILHHAARCLPVFLSWIYVREPSRSRSCISSITKALWCADIIGSMCRHLLLENTSSFPVQRVKHSSTTAHTETDEDTVRR